MAINLAELQKIQTPPRIALLVTEMVGKTKTVNKINNTKREY
jgi:hypothetical protein